MVALLVLRIWLADLLARCQGFRSVLGSIGELLCMCCRVLAFVLLVRKTVGEHGSKESLTKVAACLSDYISALWLVQCFHVAELTVCVAPLGYWMMIPAPPSVVALVAEPFE